MKNFSIKNCPLCDKVLQVYYSSNQRRYFCSSPWEKYMTSELPLWKTSHYSIIIDPGITQRTYLDKYIIESTAGSGVSRIYTYDPYPSTIYKTSQVGMTVIDVDDKDKWDFIMEIPMVTPENPEKLLKKIKLLLPFI